MGIPRLVVGGRREQGEENLRALSLGSEEERKGTRNFT